MNKKDYIVIANTLREARKNELSEIWNSEFDQLVLRFCMMLKEDNPSFNVTKFNKAINT